MRRCRSLLIVPLLLIACAQAPEPVVVPAVFHWSNDRYLEWNEVGSMRSHRIQRLYHKVLDIDRDPVHGPSPVASVGVPYEWKTYRERSGPWTDSVELVPCVYITNRTFFDLGNAEVDAFTDKLLRKLRMELPEQVEGVLLDCDWSARTKDGFFRVVQRMNDSLEVPVISTIRLHQLAHPGKTGVPPADRGLLMPYNVGQVDRRGTENSIFDRATAEPYFGHGDYPLPLDIGLPAFSWGVQFRKGRFLGLLSEELLQDALQRGLLRGETRGRMQVVQEDNEHRPELHLGDEVRVEQTTPALIREAAQLASTAVNSDTVAVVFFELGTRTFQELTPAFTDSTYRTFGTIRAHHVIAP